ncbi:hypothetical protein [Pantoea sp.]|uniref:hypothetical protein n=1 Tax=Pantoea sp. TaxID=69393 RepID=UPI00289B06E1|nr:hypothetical protein [Pantoea sp.]
MRQSIPAVIWLQHIPQELCGRFENGLSAARKSQASPVLSAKKQKRAAGERGGCKEG